MTSRWKVDDKDDPNQWDKPRDGLKERGHHLQNPVDSSPGGRLMKLALQQKEDQTASQVAEDSGI